jgi:hypothetical protein
MATTVISQCIEKAYELTPAEFTAWFIENKDILLKKEKGTIIDASVQASMRAKWTANELVVKDYVNEAKEYYNYMFKSAPDNETN